MSADFELVRLAAVDRFPADVFDGLQWFYFLGATGNVKFEARISEAKLKLDFNDVFFLSRYFIPLKLLLCFYIPCAVPVYFWGESWFWAFISQALVRYVFGLNFTWSVNSVAHLW